MYKLLVQEIENIVEDKNNTNKKIKRVKEFAGIDTKFIDLDSRLSFPIKSSDVNGYMELIKTSSSMPRRNDYFGFLKNEVIKGEELTDLINKNNISRTKLHKILGISENTLWKLEHNPIVLDDNLKRYLRRKINKLYKGE